MAIRVFISYARDDRSEADRVCRQLEAASIDFFLDTNNISVGDQFADRIADAIRACDAVVLIATSASRESVWVNYELGQARAFKKKILPYRPEGTPHSDACLPDYLRHLQVTANVDELVGEIRKLPLQVDGRDHPGPTIVLGDRRENPPQSPGDFFAANVTPRDITWLPWLRLPESSVIWNDKIVCAAAPNDDLPQWVQHRHLIIVGAPYCNLMSRHVNGHAFFPFHLRSEVLKEAERWEKTIRGRPKAGTKKLDNPFSTIRQHIDARPDAQKHDAIVESLRAGGFIDPIRKQTVGYDPDRARRGDDPASVQFDYATVTLCDHPYSHDYFAILVGGLHLPGTMAAVKTLRDPEFFAAHPFGGVVKVTIPKGKWYERALSSTLVWDTPNYAPAEIEAAFDQGGWAYSNGFDESTRVIFGTLIQHIGQSAPLGLPTILQRMLQRA